MPQVLSVFDDMFGGQMAEPEIAAYLVDLNTRGFGEDEIMAAAEAMRAHMTVFDGAEDAIDCCGTGGDGHHTLNISTAVGFVLAGAGVKVAKHGNKAISSKSGSSDVLTALGVNTEAPLQAMRQAYKETNFCYLSAPLYHPAMKFVAGARKMVGQRTIFNLLGPLANPARAKRQVVGVYDKKYLTMFPSILAKLGSTRVWAVHGQDGMDEITTATATDVRAHPSESFTITPQEFGLAPAASDDLRGGDAAFNAEKLKALLTGQKTPYRDIVLLNAAAGFVVADKAQNLKDALAMGADSIDQGHAKAVLEKLVAITEQTA
jgi:anthranilate phosphoribosyltransferase